MPAQRTEGVCDVTPPYKGSRHHMPSADVARRGADMCRAAIGLPVRHTLPVEQPPEPEEGQP